MTTMSMTTSRSKGFTGQKAQFLNMQEDGLKIRSTTFKNKKAHDRKNKNWKKDI